MNILALTPYPPEGPSARYRIYALETGLARRGVALDIRPFMTPAMFVRWMHTKRLDLPMLLALARPEPPG